MNRSFQFKALIFKILAIASLFAACRSDYEKLVADERAKGTRHDQIWLGIYLGMPGKMFYDTCRAMNNSGILSHGTELPTTTRLDVSADFSSPVHMNFFPEFDDKKGVKEVFAVFVWDDWSPWRKDLSQEKLLAESRRYLEKTLPGNPFLEISHPEKGKIWVKVDGNRQVLLFPFQEQKVKALITDLGLKK